MPNPLRTLAILALVCSTLAALPGCTAPLQSAKATPTPGSSSFGSTQKVEGALEGKIFYLPDGAEKLPDFSTLTPVGTIWTLKFDVAPRDYAEGFPGVTDRTEWFALRYTGTWTVATAGTWKFRLGADDGARWLIDGKPVVDNDGVHAFSEAEGEVALTAGAHQVELQFFQGPAAMLGLQLWATAPNGSEVIWSVR